MINVRKVKAAGLCDCCDKKKATYEVYCRISLGSFFMRHQCGPEYPERRSAPVSVAHTR